MEGISQAKAQSQDEPGVCRKPCPSLQMCQELTYLNPAVGDMAATAVLI